MCIDLSNIEEPGFYTTYCVENKPDVINTITWVSVDEQLPTEIRALYVRTKDGILPAVFFYNLCDKCFEILGPHEIRLITDYVTHWASI